MIQRTKLSPKNSSGVRDYSSNGHYIQTYCVAIAFVEKDKVFADSIAKIKDPKALEKLVRSTLVRPLVVP